LIDDSSVGMSLNLNNPTEQMGLIIAIAPKEAQISHCSDT